MSSILPVANLLLGSPGIDSMTAGRLGAEECSRLTGHFALHLRDGDMDVLVRDPLGVNKLFYAIGEEGVVSANYLIDLVAKGFPPSDIWSVPSGNVVRIRVESKQFKQEKYSALRFADDEPAIDSQLPIHAARIRARLAEIFGLLREELRGRPLFVTLSGGLDSTTIATLVREYVGEFTAITFATDNESGSLSRHSDLYYARRVAAHLGVPFEVVEVKPGDLPEYLDEVLVYGQDFRDFNVHCGLVNAVLARAIRKMSDSAELGRPCVLTGDAMNELVSDYTPVHYQDLEYYSLPDLTPSRLRRFLVAGLDSGDREVGIFAHHAIDAVQPFALCADAYTRLPAGFLNNEKAKQTLVRHVMGDRIPSFIYDRPKVRAQVGDSSEVGGTMAALLDRDIDSDYLARRFCELTGFDAMGLKRWIRAGYYRFTTAFPEGN